MCVCLCLQDLVKKFYHGNPLHLDSNDAARQQQQLAEAAQYSVAAAAADA